MNINDIKFITPTDIEVIGYAEYLQNLFDKLAELLKEPEKVQSFIKNQVINLNTGLDKFDFKRKDYPIVKEICAKHGWDITLIPDEHFTTTIRFKTKL